MENGKVFFKSLPPPRYRYSRLDDFIFIKEVDTTNGDLYLGGGGEGNNVIHDFLYLGKGGRVESDKILKCYTFDLFTLSINIH